MKKGQQIRNVSDVGKSVVDGISAGATYILTNDATDKDVFFQDEDGCSRMRPRHRYELVQPEDAKVLEFLKDRAKALYASDAGTVDKVVKYAAVASFLLEFYGLDIEVTTKIDFVPING